VGLVRIKRAIKSSWKLLSAFMVITLLAYYFSLPKDLFQQPYSTVLLDRNHELLGALIAKDGQWRFPAIDSVPENFKEALIAFEDKRFYSHPGVDLLSIGRAIRQNWKAGKIVSGGSTISMQVIRLSRKEDRSFVEKLFEIILATRLELRYSKEEILALYASHAPFGSNVVGLDAACWRYFGTDSKDLSWGQAAFLAVLPNAPSLMHPGKNRDQLKAKRDRLIDKLYDLGKVDKVTSELAKQEDIPESPQSLPKFAPHLLTRLVKDNLSGKVTVSTLDGELQHRVNELVKDHSQKLSVNQIHNAAALILEVSSGNVLAYVGNVTGEDAHENHVDVVTAPRSTGSILKPLLHAAMMDEGKILPRTLLPDVPIILNGFTPKNFSLQYDGSVPASESLVRSLNVPAVHLLSEYRYEKFHSLLSRLGMTTLNRVPGHYGLSLILGGAEGTLWDITGIYASMGRTLKNYFEHPGANKYVKGDFHSPCYVRNHIDSAGRVEASSWLSASSIYLTFEALKELSRPGEQTGWKHFQSSKKIAWKTGTSFGFRDGWAIGVTGDYAVGVWVGNADGEGRPGLTGTDAAAPLMFDIFSLLPNASWYEKPELEMEKIRVCAISGYKASANCIDVDTVSVTKAGLQTTACPFHKIVHLSSDSKYRVHDECYDVSKMKHATWFVLPPVQEYFFKRTHSSYKVLPKYAERCQPAQSIAPMEIMYPKHNAKLFIPKELDGVLSSSLFQLAHRNPNAIVYWHLDGTYLGSTISTHQLEVRPAVGLHTLTLVDSSGEVIERSFEVLEKM
jgi:penicillin-binding protein 1C